MARARIGQLGENSRLLLRQEIEGDVGDAGDMRGPAARVNTFVGARLRTPRRDPLASPSAGRDVPTGEFIARRRLSRRRSTFLTTATSTPRFRSRRLRAVARPLCRHFGTVVMPQYPLRGWLVAFPPLPRWLTAPRPPRGSGAMPPEHRPRPPEGKPTTVARPAPGSGARGSTTRR